MRVPRVYIKQPLSPHSNIELNAETSHYLIKVLRMSEGRELIAFDGSGGEYLASITAASKKAATIQTLDFISADRESPLKTHLAIGISRGERFDWVLQKATELGVTEITPLFSERTEVKLSGERLQKKYEHWAQICVSACEQSQRNILPKLNKAQNINDYIQNETAEQKFVLYHRSDSRINDRQAPTEIALLIGPEGGLSNDEIDTAIKSDFTPLTLGPRVLRTETAPITALAILQNIWGDI